MAVESATSRARGGSIAEGIGTTVDLCVRGYRSSVLLTSRRARRWWNGGNREWNQAGSRAGVRGGAGRAWQSPNGGAVGSRSGGAITGPK